MWIRLVIWATELDTSLSSSICQPASICRYRARGLSLFRGDKVKMVIELGDLSSSVTYRARFFKRRKKGKRILLIHQHGLRFIVLKHQHGRQTSCENAQNFKCTKTRLRLEKLGNLDKLGEDFK